MKSQDRLTFFEDSQSNYVQKPFVEKYVKDGDGHEGEEYDVLSIEQAKSGSGYKIETSDFVVFLRNESTLLSYLLEAVRVWLDQVDSPALVVVLTEKRPYYRMAANNLAQRDWTLRGGKYIVQEKSTDGLKPAGNPFLTARQSPPLPSRTLSAHEGYPGQEEEEPPKKSKRGS